MDNITSTFKYGKELQEIIFMADIYWDSNRLVKDHGIYEESSLRSVAFHLIHYYVTRGRLNMKSRDKFNKLIQMVDVNTFNKVDFINNIVNYYNTAIF